MLQQFYEDLVRLFLKLQFYPVLAQLRGPQVEFEFAKAVAGYVLC